MPTFTVFKGSKDGSIVEDSYASPELTGDLCLVKVTASGLCGTDLHWRTKDMVLGHEGVGIISATGPDVKFLKEGDRVGWGYEHDSCGHCIQCLKGAETYCAERKFYGTSDLEKGSFAHGAVWREAFLFSIPDDMPDEAAAPLQCGGATVFNALRAYNAQPQETVGIIGIGGLGHLAIQFAAKMGCRVVVLSGSESKKAEAIRLGAHEFVATRGAKELKTSRPLDRLIVTTSAPPDWNLVMPIMAPNSTVHPLSVSEDNFSVPYSKTSNNLSMLMLEHADTTSSAAHRERYQHSRLGRCSTIPTSTDARVRGAAQDSTSGREVSDDGGRHHERNG